MEMEVEEMNLSSFCLMIRVRHTRCYRDWISDVCSSDLEGRTGQLPRLAVDLVKGTDYFGNPIENKWLYSIREFMPIIVQGVWENVGQGRPPQDIAARA